MNTDFKFPISATLARRLAEAADGFRNVSQVYFIAGYDRPHAIKDFPDLTSAETYFADKGLSENNYGIFGPYRTYDDVEKLNLTGTENISKVDITIYLKNGDHQQFSLPGSMDAIFLNLSSFEKFVFPYYCHLYGVEYAQQMRTNLIEQYNEQTKGQTMVMALPKEHAGSTLMKGLIDGEELPG